MRTLPTSILSLAAFLLACAGCRQPIKPVVPEPSARPLARPFLNMPADDKRPLPPLLSGTGAFADTTTLTPDPALIPYEVNVPFWSGGGSKSRWIAVPNEEGRAAERIRFAATGEWAFPAGTVFVKHFELAGRRLETRVLVYDGPGRVHGASYKWRADQKDAELVQGGRAEPIQPLADTTSGPASWYYPGPDDCRKCHTESAGGVLGVNTRQLNRDICATEGATVNQLREWQRFGLFEAGPDDAEIARLPALSPPGQTDASLEERARSYLDVNCACCHRPGGVVADFDGRYDTPLPRQLLIDVPVRINLGIDRARFVAPNDPWRSMMLVRLNTLEPTKMPPIGHEAIDRQAAELVRQWITSLPGPPVVAPPTMSPRGGDFTAAVRVTLRHDDAAAVIRYTLDGSVPGPSARVYDKALEIDGPCTVRAVAFKAGHTRSVTIQETFIIGQ